MAFLYWIHRQGHSDILTEGYVGVTTRSAKARWNAHKHASKLPDKQHLPIYRAINKYGEDNLVFEVIIEGPDDYILEMETRLRPAVGIGWNVAQGGQATGKGRAVTQETRSKRSASLKGRKHSEETKAKMSAAAKGVPKSESHRQACRAANLGKKMDRADVERRAEKLRGRTKITEEGRKALSESKRNLKEWEHSRSNKELWSKATEVYALMLENPNLGCRFFSNYYGLKDSAVYTIHQKVKNGWNPFEDPAWLAFKDNYEKETND